MARQRLHGHCCDKLTKGAMSIHAAPHGSNAETDWPDRLEQIKLDWYCLGWFMNICDGYTENKWMIFSPGLASAKRCRLSDKYGFWKCTEFRGDTCICSMWEFMLDHDLSGPRHAILQPFLSQTMSNHCLKSVRFPNVKMIQNAQQLHTTWIIYICTCAIKHLHILH